MAQQGGTRQQQGSLRDNSRVVAEQSGGRQSGGSRRDRDELHTATDGEGGDRGHDVVEPKLEDGERPDGPAHVAELQAHRRVLQRGEDEVVCPEQHAQVLQLPVDDLAKRMRWLVRVRLAQILLAALHATVVAGRERACGSRGGGGRGRGRGGGGGSGGGGLIR